MPMNKAAVRQLAKQRRSLFYATQNRRKEDRYFLEEVPRLWKAYDSIFFYYSFGTEVSTDKLIELAFREGKHVFLPRIGSDRIMQFHQIMPNTKLIHHVFGMDEPPKETPVREADQSTMILVPGLIFNRKGHRLGYGGGYYDVYLREHPDAFSVGLCYSVQMDENLPVEEHDQCVRMIVNGQETIEITKQE